MPHRVATFFRSQTSPLEHPTTDLKKGIRRPSFNRTRLPAPERSPSSSGSSLTSDDGRARMPENALKRLSLTGLHAPKISPKQSPKSSTSKLLQQANLDILIESPPLVFYGSATASTGALLSGQLKITVHDDDVYPINSFKMALACEVTRKKPFHNHCTDCGSSNSELTSWNFLQGPATLRKGDHDFPFSFLLPGHLPATMKGSLCTINYVLRATVTPKTGEPLILTQILDIKRAIFPSDHPRHSIRIFPPTNLTANCQLPPALYPIGEAKCSMRMDGVIKRNLDTKTQTQWKLKRLTWRLDETQKIIAPACAKHAAKLGPNVETGKKGMAQQDVRTIGTEEIKSGWKADYTTPDGSIEVEFPFRIRPDAKPICDLKAEDGTEVSHVLIVEMIVTEEFAPIKKPSHATPTGAARVLRMHFNIVVTERSGMGISWDEEQPPLYENVPASPPSYAHGDFDVYEGDPIPNYNDLSPLDGLSPAPEPAMSTAAAATPPVGENDIGEGPSRRRRLSISDLEQEGLVPTRSRDQEADDGDPDDVEVSEVV